MSDVVVILFGFLCGFFYLCVVFCFGDSMFLLHAIVTHCLNCFIFYLIDLIYSSYLYI